MRNDRIPLLAVALLGLAVLLAGGCQTSPAERAAAELLEDTAEPLNPEASFDESLVFEPAAYPVVFESAIESLRNQGFRIARRDYRFGLISTYPKEAATLMEFWIDDASTTNQILADTLNAQQRSVRVTIERVVPAESSDSSGEQPPTSTAQADEPRYALSVQVFTQRLQQPDRYLTHSASARLTAEYNQTPAHLADRGIDGLYIQSLTRNPLLERRLLAAIQARVQIDLAQAQAMP